MFGVDSKKNLTILPKVIKDFFHKFKTYPKWDYVGSCTIPGIEAEDVDIIVLVTQEDAWQVLKYNSLYLNFTETISEFAQNYGTGTLRLKGEVYGIVIDLVFTVDENFYYHWIAANNICKAFKMVNKTDRVNIFKQITQNIPIK